MAIQKDQHASHDGNLKPSQKEIDIAVLKKEKEKLEENEKKLFRLKAFLLFGLFTAIIGGVISYVSVSKDYNDYDITFQLADSLSAYNIHKDASNNYILDSTKIYSKTDSAYVRDSLKSAEQRIQERLIIKHASEKSKSYRKWILIGIGGGFLAGVLYLLLINFLAKIVIAARLRKINQELLIKGAQELKDNIEKDFFTKLVEINFKYLDQYYLQTQEQADKSFLMCAFAACIGFVVIIVGVVMMFRNTAKVEPAYITTGAGILSEFIAAVFFYLYNKTVLKMSQYHQKLVITQNISLALKTADALKDSKEKVLETIIERLTTDVNKYLTGSSE